MGGLFGGAQTVPTTQFTAQNQQGAATSANAANPLALTAGEGIAGLVANLTGQSNYYAPLQENLTGGMPSVPLLNVLQPTSLVNQATGNISDAANTMSGLPWTASNYINQAGDYFPQASNYIGQGSGLIGTGAGMIGTGAGMAQQAGAPITSNDISSFFNPYSQNVMASLQNVFGQQNTQNLLGSTQAAGGTGSERSAVGQALLAQQQGLTTGNVFADLYQRSLQAAEQQKAQQLAAAQGVIGAGGATVGAGGAQIGAGQATGGLGATLGQLGLGTAGAVNQTNALNLQGQYQYQNLLQQAQNAAYQQQLGQYEDPFRRIAAASGAAYPLIGMGQTGATTQNIGSAGIGNATTTFPAPSLLPQVAGLGLAGAALFAARGGRIKHKKNPLRFQEGGFLGEGGTSDAISGMEGGAPLGTEDMGGEAAPMGLVGEGAPSSGTGSFGGQGDTEASSASVTQGDGGEDRPISEQKAVSTPSPEEKNLGKRNQYALMQALLTKSIKGQTGAPTINWPQPLTMQTPQQQIPGRQEGGRVPTPRNRPLFNVENKSGNKAYLNSSDEETERAAQNKLTPGYVMSRAANPYFSFNPDKSDMLEPGMTYPMGQQPRSTVAGEEPGLYADGGAVDSDEMSSPMAQAALSDDDDEDVGGEAAPFGGAAPPAAAQVNQVLSPYDTGVNPSVGAPGPSAGGMSPGKLALLQAGLGMMAASGQRDRHGLPMAPLAAIGQGGLQGVGAYQKQQVLAQRERAAQASLGLRHAVLENSIERAREAERHNRATEEARNKQFEAIYGSPEENKAAQNAPSTPMAEVADPLATSLVEGKDSAAEPEAPAARAGYTSQAIALAGENYLQTGKLPPGLYRDPQLRKAIMNYGADLAKARGMNERQVAEMWRFAPRQAGWIMGADGRQAGSLGTLIDHLDTLKSLTSALENGDNQTYNIIKNKWAKWTGKEYPTNVQAGAGIVGAEIMKAVGAAGAGTGVERETAGMNIGDLSKSPRQFAGSIDTVQRLAAGQLRTKYRQAEAIGLPKERLESLVGKRALQVLNSLDESGGGLPSGIPPKEQREINKTYDTPKGKLKWTKDGWVQP